ECTNYWPHNTVLFVKDFFGNYPKFVFYYFKIFDFKSFSAITAVPTLDRKQLYKVDVHLLSTQEQAQIVKEIESRLSVCDTVEQQIKDSLTQAEALRQSILKKAFEGRLLTEEEIKA